MIKLTLWHAPGYFQFWVLGGGSVPPVTGSQFEELERSRFLSLGNAIAICVVSEFSEIPIQVEFDNFRPDPIDEALWDHIIECSLEVGSTSIEFESCVGEVFGRLEIPSGLYRLRVCYGGQASAQPNGESEDFYLIQIWPSVEKGARIIKSLNP